MAFGDTENLLHGLQIKYTNHKDLKPIFHEHPQNTDRDAATIERTPHSCRLYI